MLITLFDLAVVTTQAHSLLQRSNPLPLNQLKCFKAPGLNLAPAAGSC